MAKASSDHSSTHDRPERSRNAKAQARHRAKRKAYIEQLEQTVTKLQSVLALSPDQVAALPPPVLRIRELEHENEALHRELDALRRQLDDRAAHLRPDLARRDWQDDDDAHRDRRRRTADTGDIYLQPADTRSRSPPPLLIPPAPFSAASISYPHARQQPFLSSYGVPYQLGSPPSTASSSPFSPADYAPHSNGNTNASASAHELGNAHARSPYAHVPQYDVVKLEEEHYASRHNAHATASAQYAVFANGAASQALDHSGWHTAAGYSTSRG